LAAAALQIGSPEHRRLLAHFFLTTHVDYVPEKIAWPALADPARLAALPFWQEAISIENVTSNTVTAAARLEPDLELRRAIELQGFEENRHARLLRELTSHYRIKVDTPAQFESKHVERDFLRAGFGECFDSFFAFGLFAIARSSGMFEAELVQIFEPVIQEEARHILFFVNWVRYRRARLPWWKRPLFRLRCARAILVQLASRVRTAREMSGGAPGDSDNFTLTAHRDLGDSVTVRKLIDTCLAENQRRMAPYDTRLARPRLAPALARFARWVLPKRL
jgi:hypothetical protein